MALHKRIQTVMKNKDAEEWPCDGPGCSTYMRQKWVLQAVLEQEQHSAIELVGVQLVLSGDRRR